MVEYKTQQQKRKFYDSSEWKRLRAEIKKRDNYECQECKRQGRLSIDTNEYSESAKRKKIQLVVHHLKELEHHPELALDEDNLETICVDCHNKEHGRDFGNKKTNEWQHDEKVVIIWIIIIYLIIGAAFYWEAKEYRLQDRIVLAIGWLPLLIYFVLKK